MGFNFTIEQIQEIIDNMDSANDNLNYDIIEIQRLFESKLNNSVYQDLYLRLEELDNKCKHYSNDVTREELLEYIDKLNEIRNYEKKVLFTTIGIIY